MSRFYSECTELDDVLRTNLPSAGRFWQVFDRNLQVPDGSGGSTRGAIAVCVNRRAAFYIRDALNAYGGQGRTHDNGK